MMEQRGTTDSTLQTAFIHINIHYSIQVSHQSTWLSPGIHWKTQVYTGIFWYSLVFSVPTEDTVFSSIPALFPFNSFINFEKYMV